jgi:hypothetical protein
MSTGSFEDSAPWARAAAPKPARTPVCGWWWIFSVDSNLKQEGKK